MSKKSIVYACSVLVLTSATALGMPMFSSQERTQGLLEGKGMGLATPAENHGYPGPRHVYDAADQLHLTADQRSKTVALVEAMKAEAIPEAKQLVADEAALDNLFITHKATLANITEASDKAARSESILRVIHLKYHLAMEKILTPEQIKAYEALGSHTEKGGSDTPMPSMPGMDMSGMKHS